MTTGERVKKVRKHFDLTTTSFGNQIGVTNASVSMMENGKTNVTERTILAISKEFGVRREWLRTGKGKMLIEKRTDEQIAEFIGDVLKDDNSFRMRLISVLARLSPDEREALEKRILEIAGETNEAAPE